MGTRILVINLAAVCGLMSWPFSEKTRVKVKEEHRLPKDVRFVKILGPVPGDTMRVRVLLMSIIWEGHSDLPLASPEFEYKTEPGKIMLPGMLERILGGKGLP
jgi:hypothetical protein